MSILNNVTKFAGRAGLVISKHSPTILTTVGVAGFIGTAVLASQATLKVGDILDEGKDIESKIKGVHEGKLKIKHGETYSEEDYKKDLILNRVQTALKIGKLYAPAILVGIASTACVLGAHHILSKRNAALVATASMLTESISKYRERVAKELGEEVEDALYHGVELKTEKKKVNKKTVEETTVAPENGVDTSNMPSIYARIFDEYNPNWSKSPEENRYFLQCAQSMFNDQLKAKGHVFLNDVYETLGFDKTPAGQVVGWVYNSDNGDNFIDFGIFDTASNPVRTRFINSEQPSVLLDFNVDGVMYDLI